MPPRRDDDRERDDEGLLGLHTIEHDRFGAIRLEGDGLIVYDTDNEDAWLQTDAAVALGEHA